MFRKSVLFVTCGLCLSSGSVTLHHWQQLAKPNLGGILHPRPGVLTKDFKELEVDIQHVYSLNDLEEDEPDLTQFSGAHGFGETHTAPPSLSSHLTGFLVSYLLLLLCYLWCKRCENSSNVLLSLHELIVSPSGLNLPQTSPTHTITSSKVLQPSPLIPSSNR